MQNILYKFTQIAKLREVKWYRQSFRHTVLQKVWLNSIEASPYSQILLVNMREDRKINPEPDNFDESFYAKFGEPCIDIPIVSCLGGDKETQYYLQHK